LPVLRPDLTDQDIDPYRRLSASQVIGWKSCPRLWYYNWEMRLKGPLPPQIIRGNAAEACICRILRESPTIISPESPDILISPLTDEGIPDLKNKENWIAPRLTPRNEEEWPSDRSTIMEWALSRVDIHLDRCWDEAVADWERSPNRSGSLEDISIEECRLMVIEGIKMHLDEVEDCINMDGGPLLENWRRGDARPIIPAPDGFPGEWKIPHPSAKNEGDVTWCEAWEIARPWFVDPDAKSFSESTCHPEGWFQGEYDIVYRWNGDIRIIDIKASVGAGDRSYGYLEQLRLYAWLWWETHDREEQVSSMAIWYLGTGTVKEIKLPNISDMEEYSTKLKNLYQMIRAQVPELSDCPASPSPLRYFEAGGIASNPPIDEDPNARCRGCDYRGICENSNHDLELKAESRIERFGHTWPITSLGNIEPRSDAIGDVIGLSGPTLNEDGTIDVRFRLQDGYDRALVKPSYQGGLKKVTRSLSEGSRVKVSNATTSIWRGEVNIELDDKSEISIADDDETASILDIETRINIVARVWSIDAFPDGEGVSRWSATLIDATGTAAVVAFKQFIPISASAVKRGDTIAVLNGEKGEWAGRSQVKVGPGTKVVIVSYADEVPEF
tara:strand:+ start:4928 stop:6769 length:1842 start_codon:yes stop_codon:yes gene_type:complete